MIEWGPCFWQRLGRWVGSCLCWLGELIAFPESIKSAHPPLTFDPLATGMTRGEAEGGGGSRPWQGWSDLGGESRQMAGAVPCPRKPCPRKQNPRSIGEPALLPLVCQYTAVKQVNRAQVLLLMLPCCRGWLFGGRGWGRSGDGALLRMTVLGVGDQGPGGGAGPDWPPPWHHHVPPQCHRYTGSPYILYHKEKRNVQNISFLIWATWNPDPERGMHAAPS